MIKKTLCVTLERPSLKPALAKVNEAHCSKPNSNYKVLEFEPETRIIKIGIKKNGPHVSAVILASWLNPGVFFVSNPGWFSRQIINLWSLAMKAPVSGQ
jgi:hypothetical protein